MVDPVQLLDMHPSLILQVHPDSLDVKITSDSGETFTLQLTLNKYAIINGLIITKNNLLSTCSELIAPHFSSVYFEEDGKEIKIAVSRKPLHL